MKTPDLKTTNPAKPTCWRPRTQISFVPSRLLKTTNQSPPAEDRPRTSRRLLKTTNQSPSPRPQSPSPRRQSPSPVANRRAQPCPVAPTQSTSNLQVGSFFMEVFSGSTSNLKSKEAKDGSFFLGFYGGLRLMLLSYLMIDVVDRCCSIWNYVAFGVMNFDNSSVHCWFGIDNQSVIWNYISFCVLCSQFCKL